MLQLTDVNEYGLIITSTGGAPGASFGVAVTPGTNAYGSYTSVLTGATVTDDVYGLWVGACSGFVSGAARDILITIGYDHAGGTSFTDWIPDLLATGACSYSGVSVAGGLWYFFPLYLKSGSSIGAKATVNNGTVGTVNVGVKLLCKPSRPDMLKLGTFVKAFGTAVGTSSGTAVTAGAGSEGAWTQLGSAVADRLFFWQVMMGLNNATYNNNGVHLDLGLGDGSNKRVVVQDQFIGTSTNETLLGTCPGAYAKAASGDLVFGRAQGTGMPTGFSMAAWGVG
jgi:hypothetical protein